MKCRYANEGFVGFLPCGLLRGCECLNTENICPVEPWAEAVKETASEDDLALIVAEVIQSRPDGVKHSEVVQEIRRGVTRPNISAVVHALIQTLVRRGVFERRENEELERRYVPLFAGSPRRSDCDVQKVPEVSLALQTQA